MSSPQIERVERREGAANYVARRPCSEGPCSAILVPADFETRDGWDAALAMRDGVIGAKLGDCRRGIPRPPGSARGVSRCTMGLFKRSELVRAKKLEARARYVDEDVQRVEVKVTAQDGQSVTVDLSLDQARQLVIDLTSAYSACRPSLLDQKQVDRIASYLGMR